MNTLVARRAFLSTTAVAGAGLVGYPLVAARPAVVHAGTADPVTQELLAQLRLAVTGMGRARGGASARQAVGVLRIAAAHLRAQGLDRALDQHLRTQLRLEGRQALLRQPIDQDRFAAELKSFGIDNPPRLPAPDPVGREQALERVLATGPTFQLRSGADALERIAARLDRLPGNLVPVRFQDQDDYECPDLSSFTSVLEIMTLGMCLWNPAACAIFSGAYSGLLIGLLIVGCSESA